MSAVETISESFENIEDTTQYCGFIIAGDLYSVSVLDVQEVIKPLKVTPVPLANPCVKGLLNLRGQIVTLISLRTLFGIPDNDESEDYMNVIIRVGDSLAALMVDEIRDVIKVDKTSYETTPETLSERLKKYVVGVHKLENRLMTVLDARKIVDFIN